MFMFDEATFARDAQAQLAFLTPQLFRVESEVYQIRYPSFDLAPLMFVNEDGDMWDVGTVFYAGDIAGSAQFIGGKARDIPYADISTSQYTQAYHLAAIGYEWSLQELQRAAKLGRNLGADKAAAATKVAAVFKFNIGMTGRAPGAATSEKNITGLVNNPSVPTANVASGTGGLTWATKTPDEILKDVNEALAAPFNATKETQVANTLLLPTTAFQYIATARISAINMTILQFLQSANMVTANGGGALTIRASRVLETAGASNTRRMVAYDNSREVVQFHLPADHEFLDPFRKSSMSWEVAGLMNVGGTEIRLPKAMAYRDGF